MKRTRKTVSNVTNVQRFVLLSLGLALAVFLGACNTTPVVSSVTINEGNISLVAGTTKTLTATVKPSTAPQTVTWSSSDSTVAKVSTKGVVTGLKAGTAKITAKSTTDPSKSATITATVTAAVTTSVTIDQGNQNLAPNATANLTATVVTPSGGVPDVTWSSSDTNVATVSKTGPDAATLTAVAVGTATITATSTYDTSKSDSITVTVALPAADPTNIYVDGAAASGGNGSQAFPFQTINEGITAVNAGGTVHVAAGNYGESLAIDKALTLSGAGTGSTTITPPGVASGGFALGGIDVIDVNGVTLEGFTVDLPEATSPNTPAEAAIAVHDSTLGATPSNNVTIQNVNVVNSDTVKNAAGIEIIGATNTTVTNATVSTTGFTSPVGSSGAGILIQGGASNVTLSSVVTSGHDRYAGVVLNPNGDAMSTIAVSGTFNETNKMEVRHDTGGTLTGLTAPQFVDVVRNSSTQPGFNENYWFYKDSEQTAILDSLFNFGDQWQYSYIQVLDTADQAQVQNQFVAGSILDTKYAYNYVRANSIQAAINAASAGDVINLRTGPVPDVAPGCAPTAYQFGPECTTASSSTQVVSGQLDITKALTIQGAGSGATITTIGATTGPVVTVDAAGVTIDGVAIDSPDTTNAGVLVNAGGGNLTVNASNLLSSIAMDDTAGVAVDATTNWWGDASGPTIATNPTGTGNALIDPSGAVTYSPFAGTAY